jgi:hypothetical protein
MSDPDIYRRLERLERWRDDLASVEVDNPTVGSFTPALAGSGGGSATYIANGQIGRYTRTGRAISIWVFIGINTTTLSGSLSFALPLASLNVTNLRAVVLGVGELVNLTANYTTLYGLILPGSSEFRIRESGDNVVTSPIQGSQIAAGSILEFAGSYLAA